MSSGGNWPAGPGLAIESATDHVEILAVDADGAPLASRVEDVGHGHTRRLVPLAGEVLAEAKLAPNEVRWIAADLGPGSFTGVRVGLATAAALALPSGAEVRGVSSLAALAHTAGARRALVVPLVGAGRRDLYAGFFRADPRGRVTLLAAPRVGTLESILDAVDEARPLGYAEVKFVGPGAARERERLEGAFEGSTFPAWRHEGLSATDLARVAAARLGPAEGLPVPDRALEPLYVRPAQAEERVRRAAYAGTPLTLRAFETHDADWAAEVELRVFADPWPESFFLSELEQKDVYARVAERGQPDPDRPHAHFAGYQVAWLGAEGHLGNLAVVPEHRRAGVARTLVEDLLDEARRRGTESVTLEVRVGNFAAQALYRAHGFRLAGLRRGYYRDTGEDALIMEWRSQR